MKNALYYVLFIPLAAILILFNYAQRLLRKFFKGRSDEVVSHGEPENIEALPLMSDRPPVPCRVFINEVQIPFVLSPYIYKHGFRLDNDAGYAVEGPHFSIDIGQNFLGEILEKYNCTEFFAPIKTWKYCYVDEMKGRPSCDFSTLRKITCLSFGISWANGILSFSFSGSVGEILARGDTPKLKTYPSGYEFHVEFEIHDDNLATYVVENEGYELLQGYVARVARTHGCST